ncbi:MAG TPA: hypothetical protein VLE89_00835 [Chlamydiales bacterium]|nr:hypothetical protein [Chlamydiales bacterium]
MLAAVCRSLPRSSLSLTTRAATPYSLQARRYDPWPPRPIAAPQKKPQIAVSTMEKEKIQRIVLRSLYGATPVEKENLLYKLKISNWDVLHFPLCSLNDKKPWIETLLTHVRNNLSQEICLKTKISPDFPVEKIHNPSVKAIETLVADIKKFHACPQQFEIAKINLESKTMIPALAARMVQLNQAITVELYLPDAGWKENKNGQVLTTL